MSGYRRNRDAFSGPVPYRTDPFFRVAKGVDGNFLLRCMCNGLYSPTRDTRCVYQVSAYFSWRSVRDPNHFEPPHSFHWSVQLAYTLLYQSCCVTSCIVSLVYWGLLAKDSLPKLDSIETFISIAMHAFNVVLMGLEMLFSKNPFILSHVLIYLPIVLLFVPYTFIIHLIDNEWPYFFFDYEKDFVMFVCVLVGVVVTSVTLHVLFFFLHHLRDSRLAGHPKYPTIRVGLKDLE
ncbi:hypothetical protein L0F63_003628 [Massospora cicadina]|nr:hypothetical protein L0F63_003628 [Massospora cicadina]